MANTAEELQPSLFDLAPANNQPEHPKTQSPLAHLADQERAMTRQLEKLQKNLDEAVETGTHGDVPGTKAQIASLEVQLQEIHYQRELLSAGIQANLVKSTSSSEK